MSRLSKEDHILRWLRSRKIGDRFTAATISTSIGVASPPFVARFLSWQPQVMKRGRAHMSSSLEWEKIAEVEA